MKNDNDLAKQLEKYQKWYDVLKSDLMTVEGLSEHEATVAMGASTFIMIKFLMEGIPVTDPNFLRGLEVAHRLFTLLKDDAANEPRN